MTVRTDAERDLPGWFPSRTRILVWPEQQPRLALQHRNRLSFQYRRDNTRDVAVVQNPAKNKSNPNEGTHPQIGCRIIQARERSL